MSIEGSTNYSKTWRDRYNKATSLLADGDKVKFASHKDSEKVYVGGTQEYKNAFLDIFVSEVHSEYFAWKQYGRGLSKQMGHDRKEFDKITSIFQNYIGKEYMEKSIRNMEKAVLNLPDSQLQTWNGKRGIWRTVKGHKIFFPNGEDTEDILQQEADKWEAKIAKQSKESEI